MKKIITTILCSFLVFAVMAQDTEMENTKDNSKSRSGNRDGKFRLDNLFTGGGIQLSLSSYNFGIGASPVIGYSINKWLDAGIGVNFNYISEKEVYLDNFGNEVATGNKVHQTTIGPIAFARFYPLRFLYVQAQAEQNFITQKYIYGNGIPSEKARFDATSLLLGIGYAGGREGVGDMFYHISLSIDVLKNRYSPYVQQVTNGSVNILPILRAGIQIPLFQGGKYYH
ncbi:MAG: hypothetical protein U0T68_07990 [Ferruginibacter sp.]